jgi:hypothetical protein
MISTNHRNPILLALALLTLLAGAVALNVCGCGPSWKQVRRHPNGVCEDVTKHECWHCKDLYPTICPR